MRLLFYIIFPRESLLSRIKSFFACFFHEKSRSVPFLEKERASLFYPLSCPEEEDDDGGGDEEVGDAVVVEVEDDVNKRIVF